MRTTDGVELAIHHFKAQGDRKAVLLCGHAMMANGSYFNRRGSFAEYLSQAGIDCYVLDWRAHGDSVPPLPRFSGHCFDDYVRFDLPAAWSAVAADAGIEAGELCYLGHSLGGMVGLAAIGTQQVAQPRRLSLWAASLWLEGAHGNPLRNAVSSIYLMSTKLLGYAPIRRLRLGSDDESTGYVQQLHSWGVSTEWTSLEGVHYEDTLGTVSAPTFSVVGDADKLCRPRDAERFRRQLPNAQPLRIVGRRHGDPIDPDHFSLFTNRAMTGVWDEFVAFLG